MCCPQPSFVWLDPVWCLRDRAAIARLPAPLAPVCAPRLAGSDRFSDLDLTPPIRFFWRLCTRLLLLGVWLSGALWGPPCVRRLPLVVLPTLRTPVHPSAPRKTSAPGSTPSWSENGRWPSNFVHLSSSSWRLVIWRSLRPPVCLAASSGRSASPPHLRSPPRTPEDQCTGLNPKLV